jgi:glycosyltransferase involved in cell wall biosynthesis
MKTLRVLVVGPAQRQSGGIARYISEQRRQLAGHVTVDLFDTDTGPVDGPLDLLRGGLTGLSGWARFTRCRRPDVVHVHSSHYRSFYLSSFYVLYAASVWNCPVVLHVHGSSFDEFVRDASGPVAAFQSLVLDAADTVVVLSDYWKDVLAARVDEHKLAVLPNAVVHDEYDPVETVSSTDGSSVPHVAFVSNHVERKGIRETVEAVAALYDRGFEFRTTIAGAGPLSAHAEDLAARYEDVEYVGFVSEADKRRLLCESSIYVLPTYAEGLPIAILEAMAGGNAIVSTTVGSIPTIVDDENGVLVPPGDADALTDGLARLLTDAETTRRMGRTSRQRVVADYSWDGMTEELVALYERLAAVARPGVRSESDPVAND